MSDKTITDMIKDKEQQAASALAEAETMRAVAEKYPDAVPVYRWFGGGRTARWESSAAHESATHLDLGNWNAYDVRFATGVLYLEIGGGRLYSSRPVDLAAGFKMFCDSGCTGNIIDILRATTPDAERAKAEHDAAEKAAEEIAKAQPVRVIGPVEIKPTTVMVNNVLDEGFAKALASSAVS